jgi:MFS family permease
MTKARKDVTIFILFDICYWFALYSYSSFLTPIASELGASATMSGMIASTYGLAMILFRIPIGILSDRLRKRKLFVMLGALLICFSALGLSIAKTPVQMLISRSLAGIGVSTWVTVTVLYNSYFPPEESQKALSDVNLFSKVGSFIAGFAGAAAAAWFGVMQGACYVALAVGVVGLILSFFIRETAAEVEPLKFSELLPVFKSKSVLFGGLSCGLFQLMLYATGMSFASNLAQSVGATDFQVGLLNTVMSLGSMISGFLLPRFFIKVIPEKTLLYLSNVVACLCCVLFPFSQNIWMIYLVEFAGGFVSSFALALYMSIAVRFIPENKKSSAMGVYQTVYGVGVFLGPTISGFFIDSFDYTLAFILIGMFGVINVIFQAVCYDKCMTADVA